MKPSFLLALLLACSAVASPAAGQTKVYTNDADFAEGMLINVNFDAPNSNQLQLDDVKQSLPFLYVACSQRGTIVRIDVETGEVLGEYRTAPENPMTPLGLSPSRTAVDALGNVWTGNRDQGLATNFGTVAQFGVVIGGTRVNGAGQPDPNGQFLAPPFLYNTCVDRDGDGLLRTSRGLADILPWPDNGDGAGSPVGAPAFVSDALDECTRIFQRVDARSVRHLAIDPANNLWVGGYPLQPDAFQRLDGSNGAIFAGSTFTPTCGGFNGLIDGAGTLWSTSFFECQILRVDGLPGSPTPICINLFCDPTDLELDASGFVWVVGGNRIARLDPAGAVLVDTAIPGGASFWGLAITPDGDLWVAARSQNRVLRIDPQTLAEVASVPVGNTPIGLDVDSNGNVWVVNNGGNNAQRISPATNTVDLTVDLGAGCAPFNLGDMTGTVAAQQTVPFGTWDVVYDSNQLDTIWNEVSWTDFVPSRGSLQVAVRASNIAAALPGISFVPVVNGAPLSLIEGRFIEVQVTFQTLPTGVSPILFDLTVEGMPPGGGPGPGPCPTENRRKPSSLLLYPEFDNRVGDVTVLTVTNTACGPENDVFVEFRYIDEEDCSEFDRTELLTGCDTLTLLTSAHNANQERGFAYVFAVTGDRDPIPFNHLIGQVMRVSGIDAFDYSMNAVGFRGIGDGVFTDLDGDGILDLDGVEYAMAPEEILVPRFFGQDSIQVPTLGGQGAFYSELILIGLSGGSRFDTTVDFLIYNDNEEVFSSEYTFYCWERVPLLEISGVFGNSYLKNFTNHAPNEILGASGRETGWFRINGAVAQSTTTSIQDPAIYAVLIERAGLSSGADLPFELCVQPNGKLLPRSLTGNR